MIGSLSGNNSLEAAMQSMRATFLGAAITAAEAIVQLSRTVTYLGVSLIRDLCAGCTVLFSVLALGMAEAGTIPHTNSGKTSLFLAIIIPAALCVRCHFLKRHLAKRWPGTGSSEPT